MPETAILVGSLFIGGEHDKASIWVRTTVQGGRDTQARKQKRKYGTSSRDEL